MVNYVKERTLDKSFKIRQEALTGLAKIYKQFLCDPDVSEGPPLPVRLKTAAQVIHNKILHGYYMTTLEDRLLVERLLNTYLVPFQLPPGVRMKKLYLLYATIDEPAMKSFHELQKNQATLRRTVVELTTALTCRHKDIRLRVAQLSKCLPDPAAAAEFIGQLADDLIHDDEMLSSLKTIVDADVSCGGCADAVVQLLKKLGPPLVTDPYFYTVKLLMDRICSVLVDKDAIEYLVRYNFNIEIVLLLIYSFIKI